MGGCEEFCCSECSETLCWPTLAGRRATSCELEALCQSCSSNFLFGGVQRGLAPHAKEVWVFVISIIFESERIVHRSAKESQRNANDDMPRILPLSHSDFLFALLVFSFEPTLAY